VFALTIIINLDVLKDGKTCLLPGCKSLLINQLLFQTLEEAFRDSIIPTITFAAHATQALALHQRLLNAAEAY